MYGVARVVVTARQRDRLNSQQAARWPAERHIMPSGSPASVHAQAQVHTVQMWGRTAPPVLAPAHEASAHETHAGATHETNQCDRQQQPPRVGTLLV